MLEITPKVYLLGGGSGTGIKGANVYFLADDHPTLVDTGYRGRAKGVAKTPLFPPLRKGDNTFCTMGRLPLVKGDERGF